MEVHLRDELLKKSAVPGDSSSKEQTIFWPSQSTEALSTFPNEDNLWIPEGGSLIPSAKETSNPGSNLEIALRAQDHRQPDLYTLGEDITSHLARSLYPHPAPESGPFSLSAPWQLPTKAVALELAKETLKIYNKFLPIFDEEDFLREFQFKYPTSNPGDAGWWACINVVLSLAYRLRAGRTLDPAHDNAQAFGHLQNALGVVSELNVSYHSLSAVQALVGMACILQGTPDPEPSSVLTAAAVRLAQAMNLHRECSSPGLTASQAEQRRRVFWMAYILDKDISLRTERPFSQDDDDMDVQLASKTPCEISEHESEPCTADLLNSRIGLAVIQGQVYKQLYSIRARRQAEPQLAIAAQELHSLLSYWKSMAQPELPESTILPGSQLSGEMINKVVLRLTYIHCLAKIDRHLPSMMRSSSDQGLNQPEQLLTSGSVCLAESRKAIRLLAVIPHGDCACVW